MEAYEFPNIERALIGVIADAGVDAGVDIPAPRPAEYVQVARAGGTARLVTDSPMVTFFIWGSSWSAAADLSARMRQRLMSVRSLAGLPVYRVVEIGGPARAPDPVDGSARYQFTIQFSVRGFNAP